MRDRLAVAAAAAIAALVVAWPALSRGAGWNHPEAPVLERAVELDLVSAREAAGGCVEPVATMRASHMRLLAAWRESAVRQGVRTYRAADGREFEISLAGTCLKCHRDKTKFCDRCHDYAGVAPGCWDCHIAKGAVR